MSPDAGLDLDRVRELFEASVDFTIGIEEEFALLDPGTLDLVPAFESLHEAALADPVLAESVAGELISSEIEIRSGRAEGFAEAVERQEERRRRLFRLASGQGLELAATGTHPWADYRDQRIIDTPHYRRVRDELRWVARRNNTWSLHVHVGIRGADRAIAVCDHLREVLPLLLAVSANSPYLDGEDTGLDSIRTQIFTRTFPRCGIPSSFGDWDRYARFVNFLTDTGSIVEPTQLWWSVRPHHSFGTVEVRICDAQSDGRESIALAALIAAVTTRIAQDFDRYGYGSPEGEPFGPGAGPPLADREIEENLWRAIRDGISGEMLDFRDRCPRSTAEMVERLAEWCHPARTAVAAEGPMPKGGAADELRRQVAEAGNLEGGFRDIVGRTRHSYVGVETGQTVAGESGEEEGA